MSTNNILSQMSTEFDEIKESGWRYTNLIDRVNGFIYANPIDVKFKDHIKTFIEPYAGAHYYAQGFDTTTYQSASMTVNLSEVEIDRKNARNGFICLGIVTGGSKYKHADIGLACSNNKVENGVNRGEWRAYTWGSWTDNNGDKHDIEWDWDFGYNYLFHYTDTVRVNITISITGGMHKIKCDFYAGNSTTEVQAASCSFITSPGEMFPVEGGQPKVRFVRFISLVPLNSDNRDYSYLKGTIRNLKLNGATWDYTKIQYAWSVQDDNINDIKISILGNTSIATNVDSIHIYHDTEVH